jgi:hypothetical protein
MATSESHCTDNFTLPVGATGATGPAGADGPAGTSGSAPAQGPAGPPGNTKIDVNFNLGGNPYTRVNSISTFVLGYVIFPGTTVFGTPTNLSFGYRVGPSANDVDVRVRVAVQQPGGIYQTVTDRTDTIAAADADGNTNYILTDTSFANLTTSSAVWVITAGALDAVTGSAVTLDCLAIEIR